ncbi:leucine-rich repeat domain-containing protein [Akkermansiaceae bacterium]|nr:leucine-rich repeat domain-containing protein [Akkermansiaceae bacterium]MDB4725179.1 leucine-rich repeat domain-containing protein [Akkermansiaceae bacterium]
MKPLQVLLALFASTFLPLHAADLSDLTYTTTDGEVTITGCNGAATGVLVIPDAIEGKPVTSIGNFTFFRCSSLTSITIGSGVTSIGNYAFADCSSLTSITIPDSVTSIGDEAFTRCSSLTSITIPDGVTSIRNFAFTGCTSLTSITIPDSVTSIGDTAFRSCTSLTSITIPDGVTSIGDDAFRGCTSLASITIPDSVTSIGDQAFLECSSLTSITFQGDAPTVGLNAFSNVANGAVAVVTGENLGSYASKWNGLTLTNADQSDTIAQLEAELAQMTAERDAAILERDARPTQESFDAVKAERDERPSWSEVKDARLGSVVLQSDEANDTVKIRFSIEETDDFRTWTKRDEINEITVPLEVGKRFYRFALEDE